jgi:hypothetical protein
LKGWKKPSLYFINASYDPAYIPVTLGILNLSKKNIFVIDLDMCNYDANFVGYVLYLQQRAMMKKTQGDKYINKQHAKKSLEARHTNDTYKMDPTDDVFKTH